MKTESVLVFDIGKTNKKAAVYDREFRVVAEDRIAVGTAEWNGLEIERTDEILAWFRDRLRQFGRTFNLRAICVSGHGATLALLDDRGALALPVLSYTASVPASLDDSFYREFGDRAELHRATATPDLGFVNMAKMLHYVRTHLPERWAACRRGLFYPQFFAQALTGCAALDPTYVGNHSYLWDFVRRDWSGVARRMEADRLFAGPMCSPWDVLGPLHAHWAGDCGLRPDCRVAVGIHDSNANLLPYLVREQSNFILASTGTWCVLMRPARSPNLTDDQMSAGVFLNQSAFVEPVLTALLPAGIEYETFSSFAPISDTLDETALERVLETRRVFLVPGTLHGVPVFPGATPGLVVGDKRFSLDELRQRKAEQAITTTGQDYFAALNLALALATKRALGHLNARPRTRVYIEGGFASNTIYCRLLATLCPEFEWVLTRSREGTSFGAALCAWAAAESTSPVALAERFEVAATPILPFRNQKAAAYESAYFARISGAS